MSAYAWIKTFHLVFVISWFAGLFYLPRLFVNLALVDDVSTRERLLLMARKLLRFMTGLAVLAVGFGFWIWAGYGVGKNSGWMHVKLVLVLLLIAYHVTCAIFYERFSSGRPVPTSRWFRWFNEVPVLLLIPIVALAIGKPF